MREEYHQASQKLFGFFSPLFSKNKNGISHFSSTFKTPCMSFCILWRKYSNFRQWVCSFFAKIDLFRKKLNSCLFGNLIASKHRGAMSINERNLWVEVEVGDDKKSLP